MKIVINLYLEINVFFVSNIILELTEI